MAVACQFDDSLAHFALITPDTRLRVFDVKQRKLVVECRDRDHLSFQYTCLAWGVPPQHATGKKKVRRTASQSLVAVGSSRGDITIWDTQTGQTVRKLGEEGSGHHGAVRAVSFAQSGARLVSAGADGSLIIWNPTTGDAITRVKAEKGEVSALAAVGADAETVYTAQLTLRQWDATERPPKASRRLAAAHAAPIANISVAGELLVTRSASERYLYAWQSESTQALLGLAAAAQPLSVDALCTDGEDEKKKLHVACATAAGGVDVWEVEAVAKTGKGALAPSCTIACPAGAATGTHALTARFEGPGQVLVARGPVVLPRFDRVAIRDEDGAILKSVALPEASEAEPEEPKRVTKKRAADVDMLDAAEREALPDGSQKQTQKAALAAIPQPPPAPTTPKKTRAPLAEMTLQDRVDASRDKKALKADSLHSALVQAVRTNDKSLLESCIAIKDVTVIENTVRRIPSEAVVPFLIHLVGKFQTNPGKALTCVIWIKAVLAEHMSYLMTVPNIAGTLFGLYHTVHSRLETHKCLLKLAGRVDLVLAQIGKTRKGPETTPAVTIINEGDDEEAKEEDASEDAEMAEGDAKEEDEEEEKGEDEEERPVEPPQTEKEDGDEEEGDKAEEADEAEEASKSGDEEKEEDAEGESDDEDMA